MRLLYLLVVAMAAPACYNVVPITPSTVTPRRDIEVSLTERGTENLAALVGPGTVSIKGRPVAGPVADSVRVGVIQTTLRSGEERLWKQEIVGISNADIARLSEYRLSVPRTATVVAAVVAGALLTRAGAAAISDSRRNRPRPTGQ